MITNISNTKNINRPAYSVQRLQTKPFEFGQKYDEISFSGNIVKSINPTKNSKEIKELVNLFQISIEHSIDGKLPQPSKFGILNKIRNCMNKFLALPYVYTAKQPESLTEVIRGENNKLLGGYSMLVDKTKDSAFVGFMTISPELKNTRASREIILKMAQRIYDNAKANDVHFISGSVHLKNKPIINTLKRLNAIETKRFLNEIEYEFTVEDLRKALDKLKNIQGK